VAGARLLPQQRHTQGSHESDQRRYCGGDPRCGARGVGQQIVVFEASTANEIDKAFAAAAERRVGALQLVTV